MAKNNKNQKPTIYVSHEVAILARQITTELPAGISVNDTACAIQSVKDNYKSGLSKAGIIQHLETMKGADFFANWLFVGRAIERVGDE